LGYVGVVDYESEPSPDCIRCVRADCARPGTVNRNKPFWTPEGSSIATSNPACFYYVEEDGNENCLPDDVTLDGGRLGGVGGRTFVASLEPWSGEKPLYCLQPLQLFVF